MSKPAGTKGELEVEHLDATVTFVEKSLELSNSAVTLEGEAALGLVDALGAAAQEAFKAGRNVKSTGLYRIVPRDELAKGLADKSLRMAIARQGGDASLLVKSTQTGHIAVPTSRWRNQAR